MTTRVPFGIENLLVSLQISQHMVIAFLCSSLMSKDEAVCLTSDSCSEALGTILK